MLHYNGAQAFHSLQHSYLLFTPIIFRSASLHCYHLPLDHESLDFTSFLFVLFFSEQYEITLLEVAVLVISFLHSTFQDCIKYKH